MVAKVTKPTDPMELTLGPVLFHWPENIWRDFYFKIADEVPLDTVFIGETVCSKRAPFTEKYYHEVAERLACAGKKVIFSTLGEVTVKPDRRNVESICSIDDAMVEANDASALWHLTGKPHAIGQLMNVYNEEALSFLADKGAARFCLPAELPRDSIGRLCAAAKSKKVMTEVQVYGRIPLALSARCYHARAHGKTKDSCQFVCAKDPDGLSLRTLSGKPFLAINGIQTLSHTCLNLVQEVGTLRNDGVQALRLSPQSHDMTGVAKIFRRVMAGEMAAGDAVDKLKKISGFSFSNGFFHKKEGFRWIPSEKEAA